MTTDAPAVRGFIGVIHLPALPGDPRHRGASVAELERRAIADAQALVEGGVDALLVENFGSAPFFKDTPIEQVTLLTRIAHGCRQRFDKPLGVNCLRNDARAALAVALAAELQFVRINVHVGAYLTDQGVIEGRAAETLRYRRHLGAEHVALLCDVLVKHAAPMAPIDATGATRDTLERGLADAVIVSGPATGASPSIELLAEVRQAAGAAMVLLGSGLTPHNASALAPWVDGAIVGTWLKHEGRIDRPVDPTRVRELGAIVKTLWRGQRS